MHTSFDHRIPQTTTHQIYITHKHCSPAMADVVAAAAAGGRVIKPPTPGQCTFFMEKKWRYCGQRHQPGSLYCGNHIAAAGGSAPKRVPCPVDPTHDVLESELDKHVLRCTKLKVMTSDKAQPFFCEDVNAGSDDDPDLPEVPECAAEGSASAAAPAPAAAAGSALSASEPPPSSTVKWVKALNPFLKGRSSQRAALACHVGEEAFMQLVAKVEAAHASVCTPAPVMRELRPGCCVSLLQPPADPSTNRVPFSLKHGLQQASIIGNMQEAGLLPREAQPVSAPPELEPAPAASNPAPSGAAEAPAEAASASKAVTVPSVLELGAGKGYLGLSLVTCCGVTCVTLADIQSKFRLKADRYMRQVQLHRLRVNLKDHLIPASPGLLPGSANSQLGQGSQQVPAGGAAQQAAGPSSETRRDPSVTGPGQAAAGAAAEAADVKPWVGVGKHCCGAATDYMLRGCLGWKAPAGAAEADTDAAGAASAGGAGAAAAASAGTGAGASGGAVTPGTEPITPIPPEHAAVQRALRGLAVAPCCHHRCGWKAYVGKALMRRLGLTRHDFELISWMTGWALCGHELPAGEGGSDAEEDDGDVSEGEGEGEGEDAKSGSLAGRKRSRSGDADETAQAASVSGGVQAPGEGAGGSAGFDPRESIARARRMEIGMKAKQLLDYGRLEWLQRRCGARRSELVFYCEPSVSGENRLLLGVV